MNFLVRFKGECVMLEVGVRGGKAKNMVTVFKNKDVKVQTVPLYMGFLIKDKNADVTIPGIDLSALTI